MESLAVLDIEIFCCDLMCAGVTYHINTEVPDHDVPCVHREGSCILSVLPLVASVSPSVLGNVLVARCSRY